MRQAVYHQHIFQMRKRWPECPGPAASAHWLWFTSGYTVCQHPGARGVRSFHPHLGSQPVAGLLGRKHGQLREGLPMMMLNTSFARQRNSILELPLWRDLPRPCGVLVPNLLLDPLRPVIFRDPQRRKPRTASPPFLLSPDTHLELNLSSWSFPPGHQPQLCSHPGLPYASERADPEGNDSLVREVRSELHLKGMGPQHSGL